MKKDLKPSIQLRTKVIDGKLYAARQHWVEPDEDGHCRVTSSKPNLKVMFSRNDDDDIVEHMTVGTYLQLPLKTFYMSSAK